MNASSRSYGADLLRILVVDDFRPFRSALCLRGGGRWEFCHTKYKEPRALTAVGMFGASLIARSGWDCEV